MSPRGISKAKIVFMYPDVASPTIAEIEARRAPKERLAGFFQLRERGWSVTISDSRWLTRFARLRRRLDHVVHWPSLQMLADWRQADAIVIKDDFSLTLTLLARLLGKKAIYLDSMFVLPTSRLRCFLLRLNLHFADSVITFSETQAALWGKTFGVPDSKFSNTHYSMDCGFYGPVHYRPADTPFILSVGRDPGRDFATLLAALDISELELRLVALPYLVPEKAKNHTKVKIFERLTYEELFQLYGQAEVAVVPLKKGITYPSGIRAVMEAMLLGVPVVASRTPVLEEYFTDGDDILLVDPDDFNALAAAIGRVRTDSALRNRLTSNARKKMVDMYRVEQYADSLESILARVVAKK